MVNIFLLNWDSFSKIINRLQEINRIDDKIRVILINNDIKDIGQADVAHYCTFHELHIINNGQNLGYAGGNNSGYEHLRRNNLDGDIIIANPDVTLSSEIINSLLSARTLVNFGAAMTAAHNENGTVLYRYIMMSGFIQKWKCDLESDFCKTDYVAGSLFIISREVLDKIGLFDERYFLYWEEVDLSFRIKDAGYELYSLPSISILRETNSLPRTINALYYLSRNSFLLKFKFPKRFKKIDIIIYLFKMFVLGLKISLKSRTVQPLINVFKGFIDGLKFNR